MNQQSDPENDKKTYRRIRRAVGYLGIFLPILLVGFSLIPLFKTSIQISVSNYYSMSFS
jgi:hypothetical protein